MEKCNCKNGGVDQFGHRCCGNEVFLGSGIENVPKQNGVPRELENQSYLLDEQQGLLSRLYNALGTVLRPAIEDGCEDGIKGYLEHSITSKEISLRNDLIRGHNAQLRDILDRIDL